MDKLMRLKNIALFASLAPDHLAWVAEITARRFYATGSFLCQQGQYGETLYIIDSGGVVLREGNVETSERPVSYLGEGATIGEDALLLGDVYSFSVQATADTEVLSIQKHDFDRLLDKYPQIQSQLKPSRLLRERLHAPTFSWQGPDEPSVLLRKRHWFAFVRTLPLALLTLLGLIAVAWFLRLAAISGRMAPLTLLLIGAMTMLRVIWLLLDWQNDFYLVTTKRVLHVERAIFLLAETWDEASLSKIQNTTIARNFLGSILGFGTLRIQTATVRGPMVLDYLPDPEGMQEVICKQASLHGSRLARDEREHIRQELLKQTGKEKAGGEPAFPSPLPAKQRRKGAGFLTGFLPSRLLGLRSEEGDQITWRKHWIFLLKRTYLALAAVLITASLAIISLLNLPARYNFALFLVSLVLWVPSVGWLWWQVEDWRNDVYIVTDQLIIDVEKKPLFLAEESRQATLDMIQNVSLRKRGLLSSILNYGDVLIQTAGATGDFTFDGVSNPTEVQREIFRRVEGYDEAKRRQETQQRRAEISTWFQVYHEMNQPESTNS